MTAPRKIVLILGNGFDLDLGRETSYASFYRSDYCPKQYPAPLVKHLNDFRSQDRNSVRWLDIENELFDYYHNTVIHRGYDLLDPTESKFLSIFDPTIRDRSFYDSEYSQQIRSLQEKGLITVDRSWSAHINVPYLEDLRKNVFYRDHFAFKLIKQGLCDYLKSIAAVPLTTPAPFATTLLYVLSLSVKEGSELLIFSFNYTDLPSPYNISFKDQLTFIHGSIASDNIIIGTREGNRPYMQEYEFLQKSFDPKYAPPALSDDLLAADDVIFFGHSFGQNDRQYFKQLFSRQISDSPKKAHISIFTKDDSAVASLKRELQIQTGQNLTAFLATGAPFYKTDEIKVDGKVVTPFLTRILSNPDTIDQVLRKL